MSNNKRASVILSISPIIETYDETGIGLIGFTVKNTSSRFENIMREFTLDNHDEVYAELELLHQRITKIMKHKRS